MTEDYLLALKLTAAGLRGRYLDLDLAAGEAPEEAGAILQQRSRWAKGHFQVFFSADCPLFYAGLPLLQRLLLANGRCGRARARRRRRAAPPGRVR